MKDHYNMSAMYEVLKIKIKEDLEEEKDTSTSTRKSTTSYAPDFTSTKKASMTTTSSTNIITTMTSTITTTEQANNIATSLHISIMMIIFNTLLFFFLKLI